MNSIRDTNGKRVIVAHALQQHSFKTAYATKQAGLLYRYYTSVYYNPRKKKSKLLYHLIPRRYRVKYLKHYSERINDDVEIRNSFYGYLYLLVSKLDHNGKLSCKILDLLLKKFNRNVAKQAILHGVDALVLFDTQAYWGFKELEKKRSDIIKIIDHSALPLYHMYEVSQMDKEKDIFSKTYENNFGIFSSTKRNISIKEVESADYHIVASSYAKKILISKKVDADKVIYAPYGVDKNTFYPLSTRETKKHLEVLFVGQVAEMKGIRELLEVSKMMRKNDVHFTIIGGGNKYYRNIVEEYNCYATFIGRVESAQELNDFYNKADVFVLPTRCEGFGFVIMEALAAGCPVITTANCIGGDVIIDGYNGFILSEVDKNALYQKIMWCANNREALNEMRKNTVQSVSSFTWDNYNKAIEEGMRKILN